MPNLDVCGTIYPYPNVGDNPWGTPHITWATAVSNCLTTLFNQVQNDVMPNPFTASGDMLYANPAIVPTRLPIGANGTLLTVVAGLPSWQASPVGATVPIGTYLQWDDFNGALTLDTNYRYADGTVIVAPGSPLDGRTSKDMSGRYAIGYGTPGGADVGTAPYNAASVGNALSQIDVAHTHTHSHTHPGPSHTHGNGTLKFKVAEAGYNGGTTGFLDMFTSGGTQVTIIEGATQSVLAGSPIVVPIFDVNGDPASDFFTVNGTGVTGSGGTANTGAASTSTTSSGLSTTQNIQPDSNQLRWIIRVL